MQLAGFGHEFQYIKCDGSAIKIENSQILINWFQYIKCDGSALTRSYPAAIDTVHFNTSNVMVQL